MANQFLNSGASRSELLAALMDKQNRRYSQQQDPSSIGEALTRTGTRLVDAFSQKKLVDDELERRKIGTAADNEAMSIYATGIPAGGVSGNEPGNFIGYASNTPENNYAAVPGRPNSEVTVQQENTELLDAVVAGSPDAARRALNIENTTPELRKYIGQNQITNQQNIQEANRQNIIAEEKLQQKQIYDRNDYIWKQGVENKKDLTKEERLLNASLTPEMIVAKATEGQGKSNLYANTFALSAAQVDAMMNDPAVDKELIIGETAILETALKGNDPNTTVGTWLNSIADPVTRQFYTAAISLTGAGLRYESGAAISIEEIASELLKIVPLAGDGQGVLDYKKAQRQTKLKGLINASGGVYEAQIEKEMNSTGSSIPQLDFIPYQGFDTGARIRDGRRIVQLPDGTNAIVQPFDKENYDINTISVGDNFDPEGLARELGRNLTEEEEFILAQKVLKQEMM